MKKYNLTDKINVLIKNRNTCKFYKYHKLDPFPISFPIDVVYTWVDSSDEKWRRNKNYYLSLQADTSEKEGILNNRFYNNNELLYSLRSIDKYAPWVNKIFIVTNCQIPSWLNINSAKLEIIRHEDIIPIEYLPTFNSHVIESYLHNIKDLSEHYVYFNDDFLLTRKINPKNFFNSIGQASVFWRKKFPDSLDFKKNVLRHKSIVNTGKLIEPEFFNFKIYKFMHTFYPQIKSENKKLHKKFLEEINVFSNNKFRSSTDLVTATWLFQNYYYLQKAGTFRNTRFLMIRSNKLSSIILCFYLIFLKITPFCPHSICINNSSTDKLKNRILNKTLNCMLKLFFYKKSQFEI